MEEDTPWWLDSISAEIADLLETAGCGEDVGLEHGNVHGHMNELNLSTDLDEHIGYITFHESGHHAIVGSCCATGNEKVRVFRENVYPYAQNCVTCGKNLVEPQSSRWPQLFDYVKEAG